MGVKVEKRTTDPEFLNNPRTRYMLLAGDAIRQIAPLLDDIVPPVKYYTYYGDVVGTPRIDIRFGFRTRSARERAHASGVTDKIRAITTSALVAWGYPPASVPNELTINFTSKEEIETGRRSRSSVQRGGVTGWRTRLETAPTIMWSPPARYMLLVEDVMADIIPRFERLSPPVTYHTYFGDFGGAPGMDIWFGFASRTEHERARATGLAEEIRNITISVLVAKGYPADAVPKELIIGFTSEEEIEAAGGEFAYFL